MSQAIVIRSVNTHYIDTHEAAEAGYSKRTNSKISSPAPRGMFFSDFPLCVCASMVVPGITRSRSTCTSFPRLILVYWPSSPS